MVNFLMRLIILFSFLFHLQFAQASEFSTLLSATQSAQAKFKQVIYDNHGKIVQTSYGRMALQRPGKFRWEITKPIPQLIVANQSRLWIYDPDLEQVTIRSVKQAAGDAPALFLSHTNAQLENNFIIKELPTKEGIRWFAVNSKKPDSMFGEVKLGFLGTKIHEMRLQDHLGHVTGIQFEEVKTNQPLPASLFTFKPPAGVDVINETKTAG